MGTLLHEDWRDDSERHHIEIIEQVRATADVQVPFNVQIVRAAMHDRLLNAADIRVAYPVPGRVQ